MPLTTRLTTRLLSTTTTTMSRPFSTYTIPPRALASALTANPPPSSRTPRTIPLCASWFLPTSPHTGPAVFASARIPSARFFDLDAIKHPSSPYPHMLPTPPVFSAAMGKLGITKEDTLVVYDSAELGIFSAPRAAWTLKVFGHERVHVLDSFKAWVQAGLPVEGGEVKEVEETVYGDVVMEESLVAGFEDVKEWALQGDRGRVQVVDARPNGRFRGVDPEPRPGLSSGHVPGSISVPFSKLVDPATGNLLAAAELRKVLVGAGVSEDEGVEKVLMCGTGVTAVVVDTALEMAGIGGKRRVYDGSWTEWAQRVTEDSGLIVKSEK
ncbi:uncharacterized protein H6S33_011829 [Morchella sextelata]|uniref:uncharacterized protein n=1 Tax=Morchella sextelata TaxID=1174677 RepID=UPI001D0546CF|nr:uncharacterized protein H6S33_011829 [Morchella sextelata]KAH0610302.1 hypothetical protein H6S33_011829 [Morchella sextelata]